MPGKIPDRWLDYRSLGMVVKKTRFITFKVPLDNTFDNKLDPTEQFTPAMLQDQIVEMGHTLGTIVDLTNTKRYYRSEAFTASKVKYHKIFTKGHVVPSKKVCHQFFDIVDNFLAGSSSDNELLGVHCTHGLNRTGYLVCRYMVDKLGFTPQDAILEFNVARGHKIERQNYIEALSKPIRNPPRKQNRASKQQNNLSKLDEVSQRNDPTSRCNDEPQVTGSNKTEPGLSSSSDPLEQQGEDQQIAIETAESSKKCDLFLSHCPCDVFTSNHDVKCYLDSKGFDTSSVVINTMSKKRSKKRSFRIRGPHQLRTALLSPNVWPENMVVSQFVKQRKRQLRKAAGKKSQHGQLPVDDTATA